ncbi:MAG: DedA family protein [archaeon GB-1867-005]|nr:DedA family protein [Candidatus Culexmicrobium cathedralense]
MSLTKCIFDLLVRIVRKYSWIGVFISMIMESACLPIPSEIVMPLTGFALCTNINSIIIAALIASIANLIGSWIAYLVGYWGGRKIILKYGKYFLIRRKEYLKAEELFERHGAIVILIGRMLPVIRTIISLPAGIFSINPTKFTTYTLIGSIPWNLALTYLGYLLGENWHLIADYVSYLDYIVIIALIILIIYILKRNK